MATAFGIQSGFPISTPTGCIVESNEIDTPLEIVETSGQTVSNGVQIVDAQAKLLITEKLMLEVTGAVTPAALVTIGDLAVNTVGIVSAKKTETNEGDVKSTIEGVRYKNLS